jgi:hypothetical protein
MNILWYHPIVSKPDKDHYLYRCPGGGFGRGTPCGNWLPNECVTFAAYRCPHCKIQLSMEGHTAVGWMTRPEATLWNLTEDESKTLRGEISRP